ncbi:hypothetical protein [Bernardetia sp.]|uniref:FEKKY domain-containing protein n=1 Tax=Bernardetia sp. TaxID=1937974 RepID=UPI0025BCC24F|nr:hypothetical protein [Bernardetia sp.]
MKYQKLIFVALFSVSFYLIVSPNIEDIPTFKIYGELAPDGYLDWGNPITEKYGFRLERIAGCNVQEYEVWWANRNNKDALQEMNDKYGKDWQAKFEKETGYKLLIPY